MKFGKMFSAYLKAVGWLMKSIPNAKAALNSAVCHSGL